MDHPTAQHLQDSAYAMSSVLVHTVPPATFPARETHQHRPIRHQQYYYYKCHLPVPVPQALAFCFCRAGVVFHLHSPPFSTSVGHPLHPPLSVTFDTPKQLAELN
mmetsp:Transcript_20500/g.21953  ORF Transcript_20500/g.21953 Transcript_20500/m.21953 type:complete len:105 (-) Transcript_20500:14-328(-)